MSNEIFYTRHNGGATLFMDGKLKTVSSDHPNFDKILQALKDKKFDLVHQFMDIVATVNALGSNVSKKFKGRKVFIEAGKVFFTDAKGAKTELHGTLVDRILEDLGKPQAQKYADALLALQDNIMQNSQKDIREELYEFLMSGKTPITMDGCFLAYKKVRAPNSKGEYLDIYTGTIDNAPGKIPRMDEKKVDKDRNRTCSHGLHFCSRGYLGNYSGTEGNVVVVVKVNPKHVFAIPTDYSFQKGRASEYYVVGVTKGGWDPSIDAFKDSFIDEDTKEVAAPHVEFAGPLRAGLEKMAESYGIVKDGKALVIERDGKYIPVRAVKDSITNAKNSNDQYLSTIENRVKKVIADHLGFDQKEVTNNKSLFKDLNADSLDGVEMMMGLEDEFAVDLDADVGDEEISNIDTVQDVINFTFKALKIPTPGTSYVDIIGTPISGVPKLMAFETKSVRAAVKAAVQKAQGSQS